MPWFPFPSLARFHPRLLFIFFSWLRGPATLTLCLSQLVPVCSVSGKRMSCPDSGNAQSIEISGRGGLGPWLLLEEWRILGGGPSEPGVSCFTVRGGGAGIL